jgi:hypothetical protein
MMTLRRSTAVMLVIALALGIGVGPASAAQGIQVALGICLME